MAAAAAVAGGATGGSEDSASITSTSANASAALVEDLLSCCLGSFSEDAILSTIVKEKHYLALTKLLSPLGMELTGLAEV